MAGLAGAPGVALVPPAGAMYAMLRLGEGEDDVAWCGALLAEENVCLLPGRAFGAPGYARIVFCAPLGLLGEACARVTRFCERRVGRGA